MKVLLCVRHDYNRNFAADSIQAIKLSKQLRKKGVTVHINNGNITDFSTYDIVHLFGLNAAGEIYRYFKIAAYYKCNIIISPNYWDYTDYYSFKKDFENVKLWNRCKPYRKEILRKCKGFILNSELEKSILTKDFGDLNGAKIINYGVEVEDEYVPLYSFRERYSLEKYVLSVGRIVETKNQLMIAKACEEIGIPFVMIGNIIDKNYFKECMKISNVKYFGFMDSYNIYNAYRFATVHVTAGIGEMPGLSSMEAAASGCNIVVSNDGCAKEYFNEMANYFDPYSYESLVKVLSKVINSKKRRDLKEHVLKNYSWEKYSQSVYEEYLKVIKINS